MKGGLGVLYIAFIFGALIGVALMLSGKRGLKSKIAFGPFLVMGMVVMIFLKEQIFQFVQKIYGF
jgi:leader peptidase (prepilin peptidase)/N-methyltransferase